MYQCWTDFQVCNINGLSSSIFNINQWLPWAAALPGTAAVWVPDQSPGPWTWPICFDDGWSKSSKLGDFFWFLKDFDNSKQKGFDTFLIIFQEYPRILLIWRDLITKQKGGYQQKKMWCFQQCNIDCSTAKTINFDRQGSFFCPPGQSGCTSFEVDGVPN